MLLKILNISAILVALIIIKLGMNYNKGHSSKDSLIKLRPVEINYLYKNIGYLNRGIMVTLLDLMRKGKISIEEYRRESRNKALEDFVIEYRFTLKNTDDLKEHERVFFNNIFEDKTLVTTDELTQRAIKGNEFLTVQGKWATYVETELKRLNVFEENNKSFSSRIKLVGGAIALVGIFSLFKHEILGLLSLTASLAVFLVGINMGMEKSDKGRKLLNYYTDLENMAKRGEITGPLNEEELIELLALSLTIKYFLPIYKNSPKFETIDLVISSINEYGGSAFDDAILRGFMGFTVKTRDDSLDTNRIDFRLFK